MHTHTIHYHYQADMTDACILSVPKEAVKIRQSDSALFVLNAKYYLLHVDPRGLLKWFNFTAKNHEKFININTNVICIRYQY